MKTIKIFILIFFIMLINQYSYSYQIAITNPCINSDYPTPYFYPNGTVSVNFRIDINSLTDLNPARCRIYTVQRGVEVLMYDENVPTGVFLSTPINPMNFPNFGYNELVRIKIVATSSWFPNVPSSNSGYAIVYKDGISNSYGSISNGSSQLIHEGFATFFINGDCHSLASGNYYIKQYKINFSLQGNFTDSIPVVDPKYCQGYSGSLPNFQERWGYKISQTGTEVQFITFVYYVKNILGDDLGYWPIDPQRATIGYHYVSKPVIASLLQYPVPLSPRNNVGIFACNLERGNGEPGYLWRDSFNIHGHQLIRLGNTIPYSVLIANLSNNGNYRVEPYRVGSRAYNELGYSDWEDIRVRFDDDPHGCPTILFEIDNRHIKENPVLIKSPLEPGKDVTDHYKFENPLLKYGDSIKFSIIETGRDSSEIDQLSVTQVDVPQGYTADVTQDGIVISYTTDTLKNKALLNGYEDVTRQLNRDDNETVDLKKDDILTIDFQPFYDDEFIVLRLYTPGEKGIEAATINTSNGECIPIHCRSGMSDVTVKVDKKPFTGFYLKANKEIKIDRISVVRNENTHTAEKLPLINAFDNKEYIGKHIAYCDEVYANVTNGNAATFIYKNKKTTGLSSFFYMSIKGKYKPESDENSVLSINVQEKFEFKLNDNHPNPFNPLTKIKFEIPETGLVKLSVYDISGREIKTLVNEICEAGIYETVFDGSELASGVYFYKLHASHNSETKRMILIK